MADVYAGDDDRSDPRSPARATATYDFNVSADTQPDVVSRIAIQFSYANEAARYFECRTNPDGAAGARIRIAGATPELADVLARKLSRLTCVNEIIATPASAMKPDSGPERPVSTVATPTTM